MRCNVKHFAAAKQPGSLTLSEMVERRNLEANPGGCNNQKVAAKRPTLNHIRDRIIELEYVDLISRSALSRVGRRIMLYPLLVQSNTGDFLQFSK